MPSLAGSAVQIPAARGCTSRSNASRPRRRTANDSSDSSSASRPGTNRSARRRSLPTGESSGVARMPLTLPGASNRNPRGAGIARPRCQTSALRTRGSMPMRSAVRSSRSTSSTASGRAVRKLSADRSMHQPSWRTVSSTPPTRPAGSTSVMLGGTSRREAASAAARPARPPPITIMCGAADAGGSGSGMARSMREPGTGRLPATLPAPPTGAGASGAGWAGPRGIPRSVPRFALDSPGWLP